MGIQGIQGMHGIQGIYREYFMESADGVYTRVVAALTRSISDTKTTSA